MEKIPGIMLALNAMVHEPHWFSASMIATGREPTLPPDLQNDVCASPSLDDPSDYVEMLRQRLSMTHQQMATPPTPAATNPYQERSLIFVMTTPPERTNKLVPQWKGPFTVKRIPNPYQVVYEDGSAWRTIHVNHAKPAKLTASDLPLPTPAPEPPPASTWISPQESPMASLSSASSSSSISCTCRRHLSSCSSSKNHAAYRLASRERAACLQDPISQ